MDWQESGAARKLLSDAELEQALQSLDTNAAIALLEAQSRLRSESEQSKSAPSVVAFEEPQQVQSINSEDQVDPNFEAEVSFTKEREPEPVVQQFFAPVEAETLSDEMLEVSSGTEVQAQNSSADIAASLNALYGVPSNHHVHETPALILPNHELPTAAELAASEEISDLLAEVVSPQDLSTTSTAAEAEAQSKRQRAQGRSTWSLIFNWNGSGALLTAAFVGYCFSLVGIGIGSLAIGGLLAFILIGAGYALAALAARRGRSVQQMLARAIFGVTGNMIPAAVLLLTKVIALAVVFLIAAEAATKLIPQIPAALHADFRLFGYLISLPMVLMVAIAIAVISWALTLATGRVLEVLRISLAVVNVLFISALVALGETLGHGDYRAGFAIYDLAQSLTVASALIVVFGLLWSTTAADENLNLRSSTIAPKLIAAGLLNWILVGAAALVAGFIYQRLDASPIYMLPLGVTVVVGSLFALSAILRQTSNLLVGLRVKNPTIWHSLLISLLSLGLAIYGFSRFGSEGVWLSVVAYLPVVGVPVSAWLGIFAADVVLRKLDYHQVSLEKNYGFYKGWNFANLIGWILVTAAGLGLIRSDIGEFAWTGYLANLVSVQVPLLNANLGVWAALVLGFMVPVFSGIPRIRRQELEVAAVSARREELRDVLGLAD